MIETARLVIRSWRESDREPFAAINADPDVMLHVNGPIDRAASDALVENFIAQEKEQGHCYWALERKHDSTLAGFCGLRRGRHEGTLIDGELDIAWRLSGRCWGKGYAREAAVAAVSWAWANTEASRICAWTVPSNARSWGLMERIGMQRRPELDFNHAAFPPGHPLRAHIVYVIDRSG